MMLIDVGGVLSAGASIEFRNVAVTNRTYNSKNVVQLVRNMGADNNTIKNELRKLGDRLNSLSFRGCGISYQYASIVQEHCTNITELRLQNSSFVATATDLERVFRSLKSLKIVELDLDSFYGALVRVISRHADRFEQLELFVRAAFAIEHSFRELWQFVKREESSLRNLHIRHYLGSSVQLLELEQITSMASDLKVKVLIEDVKTAPFF